jgi:hypothetical protein
MYIGDKKRCYVEKKLMVMGKKYIKTIMDRLSKPNIDNKVHIIAILLKH